MAQCAAKAVIWQGTPEAYEVRCTRRPHDSCSAHRNGRWRYGWEDGATSGMFYEAEGTPEVSSP